MFKKLYTFNTTSRHVKIFKYIWGVDPTKRFQTMCPYFWSFVVTLLIFPFVLFIRAAIPGGEKINQNLLDMKERRKARSISKLECRSKKVVTDEQAWKLQKTKCWSNLGWRINNKIYTIITDKAYKHSVILEKAAKFKRDEIRLAKKKREEKLKEYKARVTSAPSAFSTLVFQVLSIGIAGFVIYFLGTVTVTAYTIINWSFVGTLLLYSLLITCAVIVLYFIFKNAYYAIKKIGCTEGYNNFCSSVDRICSIIFVKGIGNTVAKIFTGIGTGFVIVGDMIYRAYKRECPIITWEETKEKK
jgi:ABC-type multidrug transport system fused ATPase/permease subunit